MSEVAVEYPKNRRYSLDGESNDEQLEYLHNIHSQNSPKQSRDVASSREKLEILGFNIVSRYSLSLAGNNGVDFIESPGCDNYCEESEWKIGKIFSELLEGDIDALPE